MQTKWVSAVGVLLVANSAVWALPLVADRPQVTITPDIVQAGQVQIEAGASYGEENDREPSLDIIGGGASLVRFGLNEYLELRLGWDGYIGLEPSGQSQENGVGDGEAGAKILLRPADVGGPAAAIIPSVNLPFGEEPFTSDEVDPAVRLALMGMLGEGMFLGGNLGAQWLTGVDADDAEESTEAAFVYSVLLARDFTAQWSGHGEVSGTAGGVNDLSAHTLSGGAGYLIYENIRVDASIGIGLSEDATDWSIGGGLAWRLPN